ncbi:MAG: T9SS type A sorting domain-containing protein [Chlorobi bacterium]|nr:T9SS type A sorting domain-containing protein [Chlorobiota bacterium]
MKKLLFSIALSAITLSSLLSQEWEQLNFSFGDFGFLSIPHVSVSPDNSKIATFFSNQYGGPVQLSTDEGQSWNSVFEDRMTSVSFDGENNIYAMQQLKNVIYYNGSLFSSNDNGQNWNELLDVPDYVEIGGFNVIASGEIYVPDISGLKYSPDKGVTWSDISCPALPYSVLATSSGRLIITTYNSGLYYSDNNGNTWTACTGDLGSITFGFLREHPVNGKIYVASIGGILESTDDGQSFFLKTPDPFITLNIRKFDISSAGGFYFYGLFGIYESNDATSWNLISEGLPTGNIYDMSMSDDHIYIAVDSLVYRREIESGNVGISTSRVKQIEMLAYPNPGSGSFTLDYEQISQNNMELTITDLNGRIIQNLKLKNTHPGHQSISINLDGFQPGIYFASLKSADAVGVQRIELVK